MPSSSWVLDTLGGIAANDYGLVDGPFGSNLPASDYTAFGVPVIRGSNLSLGEARFKGDDFVYVAEATAARLSRSICKPDDIIFTKKGTIGQTGIVPKSLGHTKFLLSSNQMKLTVNSKKADPLFVYYVVSSAVSRDKILQDASVTGVPKINLAYIRQFPILLPRVYEQREIVAVLTALDGRIELLREQSANLESIAKAIFRSWFMDFEPVRAKAEGREPEGMDAATAALFPDSFVESELGSIPAGWSVRAVADIAASNLRSIGRDYPHSEIEYIDISSVEPGQITSVTPFQLSAAPSRAKRLVVDGDVIWSCVRPNRRSYALVLEPKETLVVSTGFVTLTATTVPFSFIYFSVSSDEFVEYLTMRADGAAYPAVRADTFSTAKLVVPPMVVADRFHDIAEPLLRKCKANSDQAETLAELRDTLLPRLISGKLRVLEAEELVEAVL